jgi:FAD/FMN-containing dehydrogenase/Fe-S oxidoreductase
MAPITARRDALAADLAASIRGEVLFGAGDRALYATDSSNYRQLPIGVVRPLDTEDLVAAVAACHRHGAPITMRGAGTGLAGQTCNTAVVIDASRHLDRVIAIDPVARTATVQPGVVLDDLRARAGKHGLTFGPDPATHNRCTLGGMLGNDSCGVHSVMAGRTSDNVVGLEVLTYDGVRLRVGATDDDELARRIAAGGREGAIYAEMRDIRDRYAEQVRARFPGIPRLVSGFALDRLLPERGFDVARALVGTEGTCVVVLEATLRLVPSPAGRALLVLGYPEIFTATDAVPSILATGPIGLEGFDGRFVEDLRRTSLHVADLDLLPPGGAWLFVEYGEDTAEGAAERAREMLDRLERQGSLAQSRILSDRREQARAWDVRESALGATAVVPGSARSWPGWEDSAVAPDRLSAYLRDLDALLDRYGYDRAFYGHFGQGCTHLRIDFDLKTDPGIARFRAFVEEAAHLVVRHGGSLSGEHGDGQSRAELLPLMFGDDLVEAFRRFRAAWDPDGKMNPGKVIDPLPIDRDLRLRVRPDAPRPATWFHYTRDEGDVSLAAERCVGVGLCRREEGGVMCPSYMATHEERHSTRGRARLLWELMHGDELPDAWRNDDVRDALDLCLACKGCKGECPVNVDMATLKAEYLAHYYEGRMRPVQAYSMGFIHWWSRLAARAPGLVNAAAGAPLLSRIGKRMLGIDARRRTPRFAKRTFRSEWAAGWRPAGPNPGGAPDQGSHEVLLFPDTFNNHFHPEVSRAAADVLAAAGYRVSIPGRELCCGRPLYDWGMLDRAKRLLRQDLAALRPQILAGTPIVVLEPSCASVFRDELPDLFPDRDDARRLASQVVLLDELLARDGTLPSAALERRALVQGHCHHQSILGMGPLTEAMGRVGLDAEILNAGCCGMAGSFGFERGEHCDVSLRIGERSLLPAVRSADEDTLVVSDGFSCREQIEQTTGRRVHHPAEVLAMALRRDVPAAGD